MFSLSTICQAVISAFVPVADSYKSYVTMLLKTNGVGNSVNSAFIDSSSNSIALTAVGNASQGTFSPYSPCGWSCRMGVSNYITGPTSTTFDITGGDFTIECFIKMDAYNPSASQAFSICSNYTGGYGWAISIGGVGTASNLSLTIWSAASGQVTNSCSAINSTNLTLGIWHHIAVTREGANNKFFLNGTLMGTYTAVVADAGNTLAIGAYIQNLSYPSWLRGKCSNLRIVKGTAVYSGNYTVPTDNLTAITNTVLLTLQDNRLRDNSVNSHALTAVGFPAMVHSSPFAVASYDKVVHGGSTQLDATSYITTASNVALVLGTSDFAVSGWVYLTTASTIFTIASYNYTYSSGIGNWSLYYNGGSLWFNSSAGNRQSSTTFVGNGLGSWQHIMYSRVASVGRFFVNGVQLGTTIADANNYSLNTGTFFIGRQNNGNGPILGLTSDIVVLKGTGVSANFVPPTAPVVNNANTSLLCNFANAGVQDISSNTTLLLKANAKVDVANFKWFSSILFDGVADYVPTTNTVSDNVLGTANFTIECWFLKTVDGVGMYLYDGRPSSVNGAYPTLYIDSTGLLTYYVNTAVRITGTTAVAGAMLSSWHHYALVRYNGITKIYLNGVQEGGSYTDTTYYVGAVGRPYIGVSSFDLTSPFKGNIEDFRLTPGIARYTSNFVPPQAAFQI